MSENLIFKVKYGTMEFDLLSEILDSDFKLSSHNVTNDNDYTDLHCFEVHHSELELFFDKTILKHRELRKKKEFLAHAMASVARKLSNNP